MAIDRTIELAQRLMLQGRLAEAELLYRDRLARWPDDLATLEGLGVVLYQEGRGDEAVAMFARGAAIEPRSIRFQANLGEALRTVGKFDQAMDHLQKAVTLAPSNVPAWNSLGLVAFALGRPAEAERAYRTVMRLDPRYVRASVNLADALLALGRSGEAVEALRSALRIEPSNPMALVNLASLLTDQGDPRLLAEAEALARRAVDLSPRSVKPLTTLARVLRAAGRLEEAEGFERRLKALDARPQPGPAVEPAAPPGHDQALAQYAQGMALLSDGRTDEAAACLNAAIRLDATMASAWIALATVQAERGDIALSCQSARTALALGPDRAEAYWRLATNLLGDLPDHEFQAMERLVTAASLSNDDRGLLYFGMAAVLDRRGQYHEAARALESANMHQAGANFARGLAFNPDQHSAFIDKMIATCTPEFFARSGGHGVPDPRPVFVVGFPRSGTTLTEQVLASHPQIQGAGELPDLRLVFQALPEVVGAAARDSFEALKLLGTVSTQAAARRYLSKLDALAAAGVARVVDKMPDNINYLGLIALLFPRAKVIICERDVRDVAVSCWQTGFRSCSWNNDWDQMARRLADYQRIVKHWERVRPIPWLDISYEEMVADLEHHARRLIAFVGLDWDPSCLAFHSNPRVVRTPSLVQVRRPVHTGSVGRWRHYEAFIGPLLESLERHGVETPSARATRTGRS